MTLTGPFYSPVVKKIFVFAVVNYFLCSVSFIAMVLNLWVATQSWVAKNFFWVNCFFCKHLQRVKLAEKLIQ